MSIKQPIYHEFDLNATSGNSRVISLTHTDDAHVDVIELCVKQHGAPVDITGATVVARMVLHSTADILLNDSVPCTINDAGNILIPFDNAAVQTRKGIVKIEVNITRTTDILTLQLPLWVKINGSILDDATVDPHSEGTIPELLKDAADALEEATQALEDAKDYDKLENKPQINGNTLSGNKTSDDLGLQKKLTAGTNITIGNDGTISASGGVRSYNDLSDKPRIRAYKRNNNSQSFFNDLKGILGFGHYDFEYIGGEGDVEIKLTDKVFKSYTNTYIGWSYDFNTFESAYAITSVFFVMNSRISNLPSAFTYFDTSSSARSYIFHYFDPVIGTGATASIIRQVIYIDTNGDTRNFIQLANATKNSDGSYSVSNANGWLELSGGSQIVSGVVNQNGTITFTDSDGNTFTTTGSSVIGADGFSPVATVTQTASGATVSITDKNGTTTANISNGADGSDYVLTAQDKSDIADIVLSELPTTQGVLYGNTSN